MKDILKRINPPMFNVVSLMDSTRINEYELRTLMLEQAKSDIYHNIKVVDIYGNTATIMEDGRLSNDLPDLDIINHLSMELFRYNHSAI